MNTRTTKAELIAKLKAAQARIVELERALGPRGGSAELGNVSAVEDALRKSQSLLAEVQQIGHIGHIEWSGKGKQLSCSDELYEILGIPYGTIIDQRTIANMMDSNECKRLEEEDRQAFSHRRDIDYEYRIRRADGNERWLHQHGKITYDEQGAPIRMIAILQDITEHKQAEEELRLRTARYRMAQTISHVGDWEYNLQTTHFWGSPEAKRIYGFDPEQADFSVDDVENCITERERVHQALVDLIEADKPYNLEFEIHPRDSSEPRIISSIAELHRDKQGNPFVVGVIQDITERKQAEEALRQSESRFSSAFEHATIGMALVSPQGGFIKVNRALCRSLGFRETELLTKTFQEITYPDDLDADLENVRKLLGGQIQAYQMEKRYYHRLGHLVWCLLGVSLVKDEQDKPLYFISQIQDITDRKHAEENLRQRLTELEVLYTSGLLLNRLSSPQKIGEKVIELLEQKMNWHHSAIRLYNSVDRSLNLLAFSQPMLADEQERQKGKELLEKNVIESDEGLSGWTVRNNKAIRVSNVSKDPRYHESFTGMHSGLYVPISLGENVIGVISIESKKADGFSEADERFVATLSNQAAIAIENARLNNDLERRMRESQSNLQNFLDTASDLVQSLDENGRYLYVNNAWCETLGYTSEEALQLSMFDVVDPLHHEHCQQVMRSLILSQHPTQLEILLRTKLGATVIVEGSISSRREINGKIITSGFFHDVTARRQAEDALRASEARLNFLLSKTPAMIFSANLNYPLQITFISDSVREIVGYEPQQYYEDPGFWISLIHPDDVDTGMLAMQGLIEKGHAVWESRILRPDGNYQWMSTGASLLLGENSQPREIIGFSVNINDRKQAEEALRQSEEQNRLLFEEAPESVVLFDDHGRILRMNRAFETLTGHPRGIFLGRTAKQTDLLPPQEIQTLCQFIEENFRSGAEVTSSNFKLTRADGTSRNVQINVFPLRIQGKVHYLSTMHDMTAEKQAEETLRLANNELERALRLKDEFLANMSHELRTPLNAILGISESLMEQVAGPLNEKQVKYTQTIQESGQHLLTLINDVLNLAKINAGKVELERGRVDAAALAQSCLRLVRELAHKKGLDLSLELDPAVSHFWADERRLKQMIVNLLSNAVKFTPQGGRIGLEVRGDSRSRILHFSVWDTGIGIRPEDVQHIFKPFVQLDASLARGAQGTGLGLVLVSQMARLHGGSVHVESQPGEGSRFTISIPWVTAVHTGPLPAQQVASASVGGQPQAQAARPTVLLVEDTEAVTILLHDYLESRGYQVFVARDGFDGIAQAQQVRPQAILMDVMMPEMDGLETTRRLRALQGFESTPIIALTSLAMSGDRERCLAAGMNDYLAKPVKLQELLSMLEQYIAPRREGGA